jgi:uncharacterized damage-inducible protein DinB
MPTSAVEQYRRWYEYEKDSHRKVLDSLRAVPEGKRGSPEFAKAASLMAHIVAARRLWMFRFGLTPEPAHEFFPQNVRMEDLERDVEEMQQVWSAYYARLQEGDLSRVFEYKSTDAGWFRNSIEDILAQLFGHSWYHRGQIASLVRTLGAQPAVTDFVYWAREPIPDK